MFGDKAYTIMCTIENNLFENPDEREYNICPTSTNIALKSLNNHRLVHSCQIVKMSDVVDAPEPYQVFQALITEENFSCNQSQQALEVIPTWEFGSYNEHDLNALSDAIKSAQMNGLTWGDLYSLKKCQKSQS